MTDDYTIGLPVSETDKEWLRNGYFFAMGQEAFRKTLKTCKV
jgi:hypothetical protein